MTTPLPATLAGLRLGARLALPLAGGGAAYGLLFGALARQAGLTPLEAVLMSALVGAGAAQLAVLDLWAPVLPVATILLTTLSINARHILLGGSLAPWLRRLPPFRRAASLFFLSDESWALTHRHLATGHPNSAFMLGAGLALYVGWVGSTALGFGLGAVVTDPSRWGLDFAFVALFAALLAGSWDGPQRLAPWLTAAIVAVAAAHGLPPGWHVVLGGIAGCVVGSLRDDT